MPPQPPRRRVGPASRCAKCRRYCRVAITFLFSHIGLCALVVGYSIVGALTFEALEAGFEAHKREDMFKERQKMVNGLWNITATSRVLSENNWTVLATEALQDFEVTLVRAVRKEGYDGKDESPLQWTFSGALLYSIIVITTIGYGNIAPKTNWGKVVTIFYAIVGIPLLLLCLSNIGDAMAHSFKFIYWKVCCYLCVRPKKRRKKTRSLTTYRPPVIRPKTTTSIHRPPPCNVTPQDSPHLDSTSTYYTAPVSNDLASSPASSPMASQHSCSPPPFSYSPPIHQHHRNAALMDNALPQPSYHHQSYHKAHDHRIDVALVPIISNKYVLQAGQDIPFDAPTLPLRKKDSLPPSPTVFSVMTNRNCGEYRFTIPPPLKAGNSYPWKHDSPHLDTDIELMDEESLGDITPEPDEEVTVPMWLCLALVVSYICGGAVLFTFWEKWNFLDSSYFCFVTLTTIGFGDLVPGTAVISDDNQLTLGLCSLYLLFGMALLAMSFNLVQEEVTRNVKCIGKRIGIVSDDEDD